MSKEWGFKYEILIISDRGSEIHISVKGNMLK